MYSVEWQKRGLPNAHILIWLVERIRLDLIDDIICAEIPAPETDLDLHDVVITNMIHGPCGTINRQPLCMVDGKCSKRCPRKLAAETKNIYKNEKKNGYKNETKKQRMSFTTRCLNENQINELIRVYHNLHNIVFNIFF